MKPAFYSGASGLLANQRAMNTIGNNLANVNTTGYQKESVSFEDLLYSDIHTNTTKEHLNGSGVRAVSQGIQFGKGAPQSSGGQTDFAITGDGLFAVERNGVTSYTRDGAFRISAESGSNYLTTTDGAYVLDGSGSKIEIPFLTSTTGEKKDQKTTVIDYAKLQESIGIYRFENPNGLAPLGANSYAPSANSGEAQDANKESYGLLRGYLESSGASMVDGMVELIAAQRAFQLSARVVQAADQVEDTINNLRK